MKPSDTRADAMGRPSFTAAQRALLDLLENALRDPHAELLDAALACAALGWAVFPCHTVEAGACTCGRPKCTSPGKHPRTKNGVLDATTDEAQILAWWREHHNSNVAVATGSPSQIVVLDIDPRHGGDEALEKLISEHGPPPHTVACVTGGGGRHLYFRHPGVPVKKGPIRPGLDVQGEGAFVICPPSSHISGGTYAWEASSFPETTALAPLPKWILAAASRTRRSRGVSSRPKMDALIPSGERNTVLMSLAGTMRRRGMSSEAIAAALLTENDRKCQPPLPEEEVRAIAQSIERYSPASAVCQRTGLLARASESGEATPADSDSQEVSVNLAVLLDRVLTFVRMYVFLTEEQLAAVTLWVAHTHALEAADASPYLNIYSPEKRSGKSRLLEVLSLLVARPWLTGRVTPAALVRKVDAQEPTLLLDESDAAFRGDKEYSEALRGLLNSGWRRGGKATVCVKMGADWVTRDFSTFCPKAIAGIGNLPDTIVDRAIPIEMKRKTVRESVAPFRWREVREVARRLHEDLAASCLVSRRVLADARPEIPGELDDRAADIWEPLLAIADVAGGNWPGRARATALALSAERGRNDESVGVRLLSDIGKAFSDRDVDRLTTVSLLESLNANEEALWGDFRGRPLDARRLSRLLRPYGVKPKTIRLDGRTPKGYLRADFCEPWARYLDVPSAGAPDTGDDVCATRNMHAAERCDQVSRVADVSPVSGVRGCAGKYGAEAGVVSSSHMLPLGATAATPREGRDTRRGALGRRRSGKAPQPHDDVSTFPEQGLPGTGRNAAQPDDCPF